MTYRITQKMLDDKIELLNDLSNHRHFKQNDAYGWSQLAISMPNTTGINTVSLGNTKKELFYQIEVALSIMQYMKNPDYDMKKCKHTGDHDESKPLDLVRDYGSKGQKYCISCHKEFTK